MISVNIVFQTQLYHPLHGGDANVAAAARDAVFRKKTSSSLITFYECVAIFCGLYIQCFYCCLVVAN